MSSQWELVIPDDGLAPIQFIDVRALAEFAIVGGEKLSGIYNCVGPLEPLHFDDFIKKAVAILNPGLQISRKKLNTEQQDQLQSDYPMYYPKKYWGAFQISGDKANRDGLPAITAAETIEFIGRHHARSNP